MIKQEIDQESKYDYWMKRIQLKAGDNITQNITITSETDPKIVAVYEKLAILQEIKEKLGDIALVSDRMLSVESVAQNIDNLKAMLDLDLGKVKRELNEALQKVKRASEGMDSTLNSLKEKDTNLEALINAVDKKVREEYAKLTDLASKMNKDEAETLFVKKEELATIQTANEGKYETKEHASSVYATKEDLSKIPSGGGSGSVDLTGYEKSDHAEATYAKKTDVTSLTGKVSSIETTVPTLSTKEELKAYAKKETVDLKLDKTKAEELYVKKTELPTSTNGLTQEQADGRYAKKTDIPDISQLATKESVKNHLDTTQVNSLITEATKNLATKTELNTKASASALSSYASRSELSNYVAKSEINTILSQSTSQNKLITSIFSDVYVLPEIVGYDKSVVYNRLISADGSLTKFIVYSYERNKSQVPLFVDISKNNPIMEPLVPPVGISKAIITETSYPYNSLQSKLFGCFVEVGSGNDRLFVLNAQQKEWKEIGKNHPYSDMVLKASNVFQMNNTTFFCTSNHNKDGAKTMFKWTGNDFMLDLWESVSDSPFPTTVEVTPYNQVCVINNTYKGLISSSAIEGQYKNSRYLGKSYFFNNAENKYYYKGNSNAVHSSIRTLQEWIAILNDPTHRLGDMEKFSLVLVNSGIVSSRSGYVLNDIAKKNQFMLDFLYTSERDYSFTFLDCFFIASDIFILGQLKDTKQFINNNSAKVVIGKINKDLLKKYGVIE